MDLGLGGRGHLLTGASRGLGLATAQALVTDGARVLISSRAAHGVSEAVEALGPLAAGVAADLADPAAAETLVGEALDRWGRVAAFALSPAASYLTGTMLTVDGGSTRAP